MTKIWKFHDTGEAYDAAMCDEEMKTGDTIVCTTAKAGDEIDTPVVGVVDAWPVAVTKEAGHLHNFENPAEVATGHGEYFDFDKDGVKLEHVLAAIKVAKEMGLELDDGF